MDIESKQLQPQVPPEHNRREWLYAAAAALVIIGLLAAYVLHRPAAPQVATAKITNFKDCAAATGSVVVESSPEVCVTQTGERFGESPTAHTATTYPLNKTKYITGFDKAPDSLRQVLLSSYFKAGEEKCLANDSTNKDAHDEMYYITVEKVVGEAAAIRICNSTDLTVLVYSGSTWNEVGSFNAVHIPACSLTNRYKLSKQITPVCLTDSGAQQAVTNS